MKFINSVNRIQNHKLNKKNQTFLNNVCFLHQRGIDILKISWHKIWIADLRVLFINVNLTLFSECDSC